MNTAAIKITFTPNNEFQYVFIRIRMFLELVCLANLNCGCWQMTVKKDEVRIVLTYDSQVKQNRKHTDKNKYKAL